MKAVLTAAIVALMLVCAPGALAAQIVTLTPTSGATGSSVRAQGFGFAKNQNGTIVFGSTQVATFTVSNNARFDKTFNVPSGYSGATTVTASTSATDTGSATYTVTGGSLPDTSITSVTDPQNWVDSNGDGGNTLTVNFTVSGATSAQCRQTDANYPSGSPWTTCTSTWHPWVAVGSFTVEARGVNANGPDPSPAAYSGTIAPGAGPAQCADGVDNDGDSLADYPADPGCTSASDNDETDPPPPEGNCVGSELFCDDFSGASGAAPDAAKWTLRGDVCEWQGGQQNTIRNANTFQDGSGDLILRAKREAVSNCNGDSFSGSWLATFSYGTGWPPSGVKFAAAVPFHIEMRALMPNSPGLWSALWPMTTNSSSVYELDVAEARMTFPTDAGCHEHLPGGASWDGSLTVSNMAANWHVYSANVYSDHVDYYVDGVRCGSGSAPGVSGSYGVMFTSIVGRSGTWGSGGAQPAASDPGPWDMKVDYVKVT